MANRFVQAPSHGGGFRSGQPTLIVIHSLEAPARRGLAYDLATGWIQNAGVSPHAMTDPGETVDLLDEGTVGWHCGNGNQYGIGLEVTGYAAWSFDQWTTGDAFAAVRLDAKRAAEAAARHGIPLRWLSLSQINNGASGFCTHADISATKGGTNHTDPGPGFPYAIFMQMVQQWTDGAAVDPSATPNPQPGTSGGADPKDWFDDMSDTDKAAFLGEIKGLIDANNSVLRDNMNTVATWVVQKVSEGGVDGANHSLRELAERSDDVKRVATQVAANTSPKA